MQIEEIVEFLRTEIEDEMSTLQVMPLKNSETMEALEERVKKILKDFYKDGLLEKVFEDHPQVELVVIDKEKYKVEVKPINESAKRIIQMMNMQMPTMRR